MNESTFKTACETVVAEGYTPVKTTAYERLRAWLDETNGWPPKDWQPRVHPTETP